MEFYDQRLQARAPAFTPIPHSATFSAPEASFRADYHLMSKIDDFLSDSCRVSNVAQTPVADGDVAFDLTARYTLGHVGADIHIRLRRSPGRFVVQITSPNDRITLRVSTDLRSLLMMRPHEADEQKTHWAMNDVCRMLAGEQAIQNQDTALRFVTEADVNFYGFFDDAYVPRMDTAIRRAATVLRDGHPLVVQQLAAAVLCKMNCYFAQRAAMGCNMLPVMNVLNYVSRMGLSDDVGKVQRSIARILNHEEEEEEEEEEEGEEEEEAVNN